MFSSVLRRVAALGAVLAFFAVLAVFHGADPSYVRAAPSNKSQAPMTLIDCDCATCALQYDATSNRFSCKSNVGTITTTSSTSSSTSTTSTSSTTSST